ncbi:hypothetical protein HMPREF3208_01410 [Gardnerella vaginalis]|uniref:Uncharacterized protein n=1 Tax=Gardnerella vaginalis TaxID=2702 RepID=A0A133NNU4_GARVA|nr:hypothetical protein HMPREF3208_01410 [Gardnerella vaginalis]
MVSACITYNCVFSLLVQMSDCVSNGNYRLRSALLSRAQCCAQAGRRVRETLAVFSSER